VKNFWTLYESVNSFNYRVVFSDNSIKYIPKNFVINPDRKILEFNRNLIKTIPEEWNPGTLAIVLSENIVENIPKNWLLNSLTSYLHLNNNRINNIPKDWSPVLEELYLGNNLITSIPELWNPLVKYLDLSNNSISHLPINWLSNNNVVQKIDLRNTQIPKEKMLAFMDKNWDNIKVLY
jgi:Leucine-rich repeat (LRR) protein